MAEIEEVAIQIDGQSEISTKTNKGMRKLKRRKLKVDEDAKILAKDLHISMKKRLRQLPCKPLEDRSLSIFRLPGWIHENNKELCEPKMVAIGPYHHGKQSLQTMEEHKWYTLRNFLARKDVGLKVYLQAMISIEAQARNCYSETEKLGSGDFIMMLLLDSCFILEWFSIYVAGVPDSCLDVGWAPSSVLSDMLLLENQVPFFVIHKLFFIQDEDIQWRPNCEGGCRLVELLSNVLKREFFFTQFRSSEITCDEVNHLLHLCYTGALPDPLPGSQSDKGNSDANISNNCCSLGNSPWSKLYSKFSRAVSERSKPSDLMRAIEMSIPCLTELHDAGIKIKRKKNPTSMLDISFKNGTIEMPFLQIEVPKIRILWNMVAFEQSCQPCYLPQVLSSYLALMDTLINTEKDVSILEQSGILDNLIQNAEEAATFFNQFDKIFSLDYNDHYFKGLFRDIREYSQSRWQRYRARLMQDYFSNPWSIISVVAAGVLLGLTILQTYYSAAN